MENEVRHTGQSLKRCCERRRLRSHSIELDNLLRQKPRQSRAWGQCPRGNERPDQAIENIPDEHVPTTAKPDQKTGQTLDQGRASAERAKPVEGRTFYGNTDG